MVTPAAILPRIKQFRVVGVFEAGMFEFGFRLGPDAPARMRKNCIAWMIASAACDSRSSTLRRAADRARIDALPRRRDLDQRLDAQPRQFLSRGRNRETHDVLILLLIVAVAAFNIVSTLVMAVQDKRADIAILRTLGASPRSIMGIFVVQGR
jgi:lipoprotein-releasing system permease protein